MAGVVVCECLLFDCNLKLRSKKWLAANSPKSQYSQRMFFKYHGDIQKTLRVRYCFYKTVQQEIN